MDPKAVDQFLKNKVQDLKDQKRHEEMIGLVSLLGESISEDIKSAISEIKIDSPIIPEIKIPDINIPEPKEIKLPVINIPEIKVPTINVPAPQVTVNVPEIKLPTINVPEPRVTVNVEKPDAPIVNIPPFPKEMRVNGDVGISGVDRKNPFPVQLVDLKGRPYEAVSGGSGGGNPFVVVTDIRTSSGASVIDQDSGAMKITGNISVSAVAASSVSLVNADGTYYNSDNPLPVTGTFSSTPGLQVSGAADSVNVIQTVGLTDTQLRANTLDVHQVSGASDSVNVLNTVTVTGPLTNTELRATTIDVQQVSGVSWSTNILSIPAVVVTSITNTIASNVVDSSGVAYSGSNPIPSSEIPTATSPYCPTNSTSTAYENKRTAKASAGTLYSVNGYNSSTAAQFIQIHNVTSDPAEASVPVVIIRVPASSNFSYSADKFGRFFSTGIHVTNSSTGPTKTLQAADCWFDILYQ